MKQTAIDRALTIIKMRGELTSSHLATELGLTKEGARLNLLKLVEEGLVHSFAKNEGVGRPGTYYSLSEKGLTRLPDTHAQLAVTLLQSAKKLLGEQALDQLANEVEQQTCQRYKQQMQEAESIDQRLELLARIRSEEGYMAEWKQELNEYLFIENHCPIGAAAIECPGFCKAEQNILQALLGEDYKIVRIQHIPADGQRCVYRITR